MSEFDTGGEATEWVGPSQEEWEATQAQLGELSGMLEAAHEAALEEQSLEESEALLMGLDPLDDDFVDNLTNLLAEQEQALGEHVEQALAPVREMQSNRLLGEALDAIGQEVGEFDRQAVMALASQALRGMDPEELAEIDDTDEFAYWLLHSIASKLTAEQAYRGLRDEVEIVNAIVGGRQAPRSPKVVPGGSDDELAVAMRFITGARR